MLPRRKGGSNDPGSPGLIGPLDPRRRHSHKTQNARVRPPRRHRRHTIAPRSFRGPARPHRHPRPRTRPCTAARGEVQVAHRATPYHSWKMLCHSLSYSPFFRSTCTHVINIQDALQHFLVTCELHTVGGPLWCTEHAYPCSPQHGRGAAITGSCTARLYSISSSASPPPPPLALIALRLLRPGRPPP